MTVPRVFVLRLSKAGSDSDSIHALRALLKLALRRFGFRCLDAREEITEPSARSPEGG
jgi:hypothetical protein